MRKLLVQTVFVAIVLIAVVAVMLHLPEIAGPAARHPDFAGALIGAAGTIFAGWLAWAAVQWQASHTERMAAQSRDEAVATIRNELLIFSDYLTKFGEQLI